MFKPLNKETKNLELEANYYKIMCRRFELYVQVYNLNIRTEQNEEQQNENGERLVWKM
jgi:hypothetical protein